MAVTNIPNVQNWTVTPQNGQAGYFGLMNTWLGQSTLVIASLQTAIAAQNTANSEINALAIQTENNAIVANGLANFQGDWSGLVSYDKGESVESTAGSKIYYISKVDNNLNHAVTDTNYWLYSPINDKLDKDFSILTDKATPSDTDILAIREKEGLLKKLTWFNIKATLKTYFDTLYTIASSETTRGIIEIATTAEAQAGTDDSRAITPLKLKNSVIGLGQTWQDVTASRVLGTTYTNSTGKPIFVTFDSQAADTGASQAMEIAVNGASVAYTNNSFSSGALFQGYRQSLTAIVPTGATYQYNISTPPRSFFINELR